MGMSAQRELGIAFRQNLFTPTAGIVLKHDNEGRRTDRYASKCLNDVTLARHAFLGAPILHTSNDNAV